MVQATSPVVVLTEDELIVLDVDVPVGTWLLEKTEVLLASELVPVGSADDDELEGRVAVAELVVGP